MTRLIAEAITWAAMIILDGVAVAVVVWNWIV
jgi:hypothetical protein